jgi:hypothetical protein
MFAVGPLFTATGGHPCYRGEPPGDSCQFIDDVSEVQPALDAVLPYQPDMIKAVVEPGSSLNPLPKLGQDPLTTLQAATSAAGLRLIEHLSTSQDLDDSLTAGVRFFGHVPSYDLMTPAQAQRAAQLGAVVVPTLAVLDNLYPVSTQTLSGLNDPALADDVTSDVLASFSNAQDLGIMSTPAYQDWASSLGANSKANFLTLVQAGVTIASGTDSGNPGTFHGPAEHHELQLYAANGMTPLQALTAGTRSAADVLRRSDLGRLSPGAIADVLVVQGDATSDLSALDHVMQVYLAGTALDRDALSVKLSTSLVQVPVTGRAQGETCLETSECSTGLYCSPEDVCRASCSRVNPCASGSACFPQNGNVFAGYCQPGDGCDPIEQNCVNDAACLWLGNAMTLCTFASAATDGQPCSANEECATGDECNFNTMVCQQLCTPTTPDGGVADGGLSCPGTEVCMDMSVEAGIPIGQCQ